MRKRTINNMNGGYRAPNQQSYIPPPINPGDEGKDDGKDDGKDKDTKIVIKPNIDISVGSAFGGLAAGIISGLTAYHFYQKNRRNNEPIIPANRGLGYEENVRERQPSIGLQTSFTVNDLPVSGQNYDPDKDQDIEFDPQSSLFRPDESSMFALFNPEEDQPEPEEEEDEDPIESKYDRPYDVASLSNEEIDRQAAEIERELSQSAQPQRSVSRILSERSASNISSRRSNPGSTRLGDPQELPSTSGNESERSGSLRSVGTRSASLRSVGYPEQDIVPAQRTDTAGSKLPTPSGTPKSLSHIFSSSSSNESDYGPLLFKDAVRMSPKRKKK